MPAPEVIVKLVARYKAHEAEYSKPHYNEAELRNDFLDAFFEALGWDTRNRRGYHQLYREVLHEETLKVVGESSKTPDYTFRIGTTRKFFVEAKKPHTDILSNFDAARQIRRYAWNAGLSLSILTNFRHLAVYDTRTRPKHGDSPAKFRIKKWAYEEYVEKWDEIAAIFGREEILQGGFDEFVDSAPKRGTIPPGVDFLNDLDDWRLALAKNIARNNTLSDDELNYAVGQTLDRIIFLRICEDRGTEAYGSLRNIMKGSGVYTRLLALFQKADQYYNSGLFYFKKHKNRTSSPDILTTKITISDSVLRDILSKLYEPLNDYEFLFLPVEVLGQAYEQFLGRVIERKGRTVTIVEKPEVKKAGGVVYTPSYIVDYMVDKTVGALCKGKALNEVTDLRILDPACGSGSFLLGVYGWLLNWYLQWHTKNGGPRSGAVYQAANGEWRLSEKERRRILVDHIFGVDIDPQAIEVTKLSLVLKMLEGVSKDSIEMEFFKTHEPALPDLDGNIVCGNSLISSDIYQIDGMSDLSDSERRRINAFDWTTAFPIILGRGGFDAVLGNPPYVLQQGDFRDEVRLKYYRAKYLAAFKIDLYHLFIERAFELTRVGGTSALITPSNYLANNYMAKLRRAMIEKGGLHSVVVIDGNVFKRRSVDTAIFLASKGLRRARNLKIVHAAASPTLQALSTTALSVAHILRSEEILFTGSDSAANSLWERLSKTCTALGKIAHVNFGKQLRDRNKFPDDVIRVAAGGTIPLRYRACYTGDDVERFNLRWGGLICLDDTIARKGGCWDAERQDQAIKILTRQIGFWPEYALDQNGYQCLNTVFMVNERSAYDVYCLLGILNSSVLRAFWIDKYWDRRRTFPKIKGTYLKKLPIPKSLINIAGRTALTETLFHDLQVNVQRALAMRIEREKAGPQRRNFLDRDIPIVDTTIDALVYRAFGLSADDIAVVERIISDHRDLEVLYRNQLTSPMVS